MTAEEHHVTGGLGGAVAEFLAENRPTKMRLVGLGDEFAVVGPTVAAAGALRHERGQHRRQGEGAALTAIPAPNVYAPSSRVRERGLFVARSGVQRSWEDCLV